MRASLIFFFCLVSLVELSRPMTTVVADGLAEWKTPTSLQVGESLAFNHKRHQNLYIFRSRSAFDRCNFARAAIIYKGTSANFTWSPSRPGYYYFSTRENCDKGEKVSVRVIGATPADLYPALPPVTLPAPPPSSGGDSSPSPSAHGWGWVSSSPSSPSPAPDSSASPLAPKEGNPPSAPPPAPPPASAPESGGGMPFLNSNPAVPLPTGMTDTSSIRPLPTPGDGSQVVGLGCSSVRTEEWLLGFVMMLSAVGLWM